MACALPGVEEGTSWGVPAFTYYLTYHYEDYPCVLVRLGRVHPDALRDLLKIGWEFVAKPASSRTSANPSRRGATPPDRRIR
jgi:hypothetical protein